MPMNKRMTLGGHEKQQGVVLVISLLLLLVITLVGISSLSTTVLEEKMTSNMQAKHVVFQAADSLVEEAVDDTDFLWAAYTKGINPATPELLQSDSELYASFLQDASGDPVPIPLSTKEVSAEFKGNTVPIGANATSLRLGSSAYQLYHYNLEGTAELADQNARAVHAQGAHLKGASTSQ